MTTAVEALVLMDFLRKRRVTGIECEGEDYTGFDHLPEACPDEVSAYWRWETELRAVGPVAEEAYHLIRDVAKDDWRESQGERWEKSRQLRDRAEAWGKTGTCPV